MPEQEITLSLTGTVQTPSAGGTIEETIGIALSGVISTPEGTENLTARLDGIDGALARIEAISTRVGNVEALLGRVARVVLTAAPAPDPVLLPLAPSSEGGC